jgi:response regulator RpfG family c-di-GMP phosphodiesterase
MSGSHNSQNEILHMMKNGANDFISKPFNIESLIIKVEQFIKLEELHIDLENKNKELEKLIFLKEVEIRQKEEEIIKQSKQAIMGEMIYYIIHQ